MKAKARQMNRAAGLASVAAMVFGAVAAQAETFVWDGGDGSQTGWAVDANWVGDTAPTNNFTGGDFVFDAAEVLAGGFSPAFNRGVATADSVSITGGAGNFSFGTISGNHLTVNGALAVDSGTHTWAGTGELRIGSNTVFDIAAGASFTRSSVLGGTGQLVKSGGGTLFLGSNNNTFTGNVAIVGGTISILNSNGRLGDAANRLSMDGGTLQFTGTGINGTITRDTVLGSGGGTIQTDTADKYIRWSRTITGAGALTKAGAGILELNASNGHGGGTLVAAGTLKTLVDYSLGDTEVGDATLVLAGGNANDSVSDLATLVLDAGSSLALDFTGAPDLVGALSLDGGTTWLPEGTYNATDLSGLGAGSYSGSGSLAVVPASALSAISEDFDWGAGVDKRTSVTLGQGIGGLQIQSGSVATWSAKPGADTAFSGTAGPGNGSLALSGANAYIRASYPAPGNQFSASVTGSYDSFGTGVVRGFYLGFQKRGFGNALIVNDNADNFMAQIAPSNLVLRVRIGGVDTATEADTNNWALAEGDLVRMGLALDMAGKTATATYENLTQVGKSATAVLDWSGAAYVPDVDLFTVQMTGSGAVTLDGVSVAPGGATTSRGTPYAWLDLHYPGLSTPEDYENADLDDGDGDGLAAWQEYIAGTVPTDGASVFAFSAAQGAAGGHFVVTWQSVEGKSYSVSTNRNLIYPNWGVEASGIPGQDGATSYTTTPANAATFFKVEVQ